MSLSFIRWISQYGDVSYLQTSPVKMRSNPNFSCLLEGQERPSPMCTYDQPFHVNWNNLNHSLSSVMTTRFMLNLRDPTVMQRYPDATSISRLVFRTRPATSTHIDFHGREPENFGALPLSDHNNTRRNVENENHELPGAQVRLTIIKCSSLIYVPDVELGGEFGIRDPTN